MKKATFTERLLAFFLDSIIVFLISSLIASSFSNKKLEKLQTELENTVTNYMQGELTIEEYLEEIKDLTYEIEKNSTGINLVQLVISIGYFIIFTYLNKGQTLGKKLLKLKIVNEKEEKPTILQIMLRTSIIYQILPSLLIIILVLFIRKEYFLTIYSILTMITYIFILASAIMILYRNDKLGIQDILSKTKIVKEGR